MKHDTHDLNGCYGTDAECPCPLHETDEKEEAISAEPPVMRGLTPMEGFDLDGDEIVAERRQISLTPEQVERVREIRAKLEESYYSANPAAERAIELLLSLLPEDRK